MSAGPTRLGSKQHGGQHACTIIEVVAEGLLTSPSTSSYHTYVPLFACCFRTPSATVASWTSLSSES